MRIRLVGLAFTIAALAVAPSTAGAATFDGGTLRIDLKRLTQNGVRATFTNAASSSRTAGKFELSTGTATLSAQSNGRVNVAGTNRSVTLRMGGRELHLTGLAERLANGRGQLTATIGTKTVAVFDEASAGKVGPSPGFTELEMSSSTLRLTKAGAAALNNAFELTRPREGQRDRRFKAKQKVGSAEFSAIRSLTVVGGNSQAIYDIEFYDKLKNDCDITQSAGAGSTEIPVSDGAPRGGVDLPVVAGALTADTLRGAFSHDGGTRLDRPAGSPKGAEYHSRLTQFIFGTSSSPPSVSAFSSELFGRLPIGSLTGARLSAALTATTGSVRIDDGTLTLSNAAVGALRSLTGCDLATGSRIGLVTTVVIVL